MSVGGPIPPLKISPRAPAVLGLRALDLAGPLSAVDPKLPLAVYSSTVSNAPESGQPLERQDST